MKRLKISHSIIRSLLFLQELWKHPQKMGAVCPSSPRLAKVMADQIEQNKAGWVIEIGAGTGAVTEALLAVGLPVSRLLVIERSAALVEYLRKTFPDLRVIQGDAAQLRQLLPEGSMQVNSIVSSLPLLSLPQDEVSSILKEFHALLPPDGKLIQYTYDVLSLKTKPLRGFKLIKAHSIWLNLPPAKVQVFCRK